MKIIIVENVEDTNIYEYKKMLQIRGFYFKSIIKLVVPAF